ncbi:MAG: hypothetical protein IPG71_08965 [bacterium]|nr:hypothetical protein [bacterium]
MKETVRSGRFEAELHAVVSDELLGERPAREPGTTALKLIVTEFLCKFQGVLRVERPTSGCGTE